MMVPVTASQIRSLSSVTCPRMERSCLHEFTPISVILHLMPHHVKADIGWP